MTRWAAVPLAVALLAAACSGGESQSQSEPEPLEESEPVITDTVDCEGIVRTFVGRERAVPGDQVQLDVFPIAADGAFVDGTDCVTVRDDADGARMESAARVAATTERIVAVVVDPGRTDEDLARARQLTADVVAQYPDEQVALYALGPAEDAHAGGVQLLEEDLSWAVAADPEEVDQVWRTSRFAFQNSFLEKSSADEGWPEPRSADTPAFARAVFSVFDEASITDAELSVEHTHGLVLWVNGVEVLRSNMADEGDAPANTNPGLRSATVTVPAQTLISGTNVISADVYRSANGDPITVDVTLTASDPRQQPVAALAPSAVQPDLGTLAQLVPTAAPPGRLAEALDLVIEELEETHDDEAEALRAVVVVTPEAAPDLELGGRSDAVLVWMGAGDDPLGDIDLAIDAQEDDPVGHLVDRLNHVGASRLVVGVCGRGTGFEAEVEVGVVNLTTTLREPPPEDPGGECDPESAAQYEPAPPDHVAVVFSPEQRTTWTEHVAINDRTPFRAEVDLGNGWGPAPAELRLRGQTSIECDRKSYAVNLDSGHRRTLTDEVAADEFFLLSLCLDAGYVRTATMLDLLERMGLFPAGSRLVTLDLDGESAGVYLLTEPPDEALRDSEPALDGVVRRALDTSFQTSTATWSSTDRDDAVLGPYERTIELAEAAGADLLARLDEVLDVDSYLTWLAAMSATGNGDYVDEVFFAGVGTLRDGEVAPYWYPIAWDPDDLFTPCHFEDFQFRDPYGLATCAEARLDHALLGSDEGYAAYVAALDGVLAEITPPEFAAALGVTRARLDVLVDDEVAAAMPEIAELTALDTTKAAGFLEAVDREIGQLNSLYSARHADLGDGIAVWRAGGGGEAPLVAEFAPVAAAGAAVPVRVTATGPSGEADRSLSGTVTVRIGTIEASAPMRRGVAVANLLPGDVGEQEVAVNGEVVGTLAITKPADPLAEIVITERAVWGPGLVAVEGEVVVDTAGLLVVEPGTTLLMGSGAALEILGRLEMRGTHEQPILLTEQSDPWSGIRVLGEAAISHTFLTGGGSDSERHYGHSDSQPILFGGIGSVIGLDGVVIADSAGKATAVEGGTIDIANSVFTRTDTGGEFHNAVFNVTASWFLGFPTDEPEQTDDDDNDAIYLGPTRSPSAISDTVFIAGADDGIDHAGADVSIERVWIEAFRHECIATSVGGSVAVADSVLRGCEHGLELGYGSPSVVAEQVLVLGNDIGVRYGDEYEIEATGGLELNSVLLVGNTLSIEADPAAVTVAATVSDQSDESFDGVVVATPRLDADLVWRDGGLDPPGIITGWP